MSAAWARWYERSSRSSSLGTLRMSWRLVPCVESTPIRRVHLLLRAVEALDVDDEAREARDERRASRLGRDLAGDRIGAMVLQPRRSSASSSAVIAREPRAQGGTAPPPWGARMSTGLVSTASTRSVHSSTRTAGNIGTPREGCANGLLLHAAMPAGTTDMSQRRREDGATTCCGGGRSW